MSFSGVHVILVGPLPPPAGGMATQTVQLGHLLTDAGASVHIVQTNLPYRPAWLAGVPGLRALMRLLCYVRRLWRALRSGGATVMHLMANSGWSWHLFAVPAIVVARLHGVPVVVNYRGGGAAAFLAAQHRWVRPILARAQVLILPSRFLLEIFARYGVEGRIVPNVIDLDLFFPPMAPRERSPAPHLVVTRHLEAIYDNACALRACARLVGAYPGIRLTIAGTGPERAALERLAHELGIQPCVRFVCQLSRQDVAELYRHADVMLNPSRAGNMPNSVLEAMASGVVVVSTDVGGVPYLIEDGRTGLLVAAGDDQAMAEAVARVCSDEALRRRLVDAAREEVGRYRWSEVAPLLASAYAEAMKPGQAMARGLAG